MAIQEKIDDILIIGGGPVGLYGAYVAGLHRFKVRIVERLERLGGQAEYLFPDKPVYDVGGIPAITGRQLVEQLKRQAYQSSFLEVSLGEAALRLERQPDLWVLDTTKGRHYARCVIITAGIGEFRPRKLDNPRVDGWEGQGVHYVVDRLSVFQGRRVLVVGGGNSAADWAMALIPLARSVTMIHRRSEFQCHADSLAKLRAAPEVTMIPNATLEGCDGVGHVASATIRRLDLDREETLPVEEVIVAIGLIPEPGPLAEWGLIMVGPEIQVDARMATNLPMVYAAGDIVHYPGKVKLMATGFGEVATAVESARQALKAMGIAPH
ncbi:MAG: NAD(P)/FAD-dependent oxidoreductase [Firmicutes bacterium]|jgi:thioredoxin reductase|nr:NAD(P)/FAD-dependent oxidoreductase [Bacillota bacterium]